MGEQAGSVYYVFVAAVFFAYWVCAGWRLPRLAVILFANCLFCVRFGLFYVLLIPCCATVDFLIGLGLARFRRAAVRKLLVGGSIASSFVIEDIKVGRNSQFVATGAQPAEAFKDTATGDNVSLDTCKPGVDLTLIVTNITGAASDFRASLFGDSVE